jgi:hypothetical protein
MGYKRNQTKCVLRLSFSNPNLSSFPTPIVYSTCVLLCTGVRCVGSAYILTTLIFFSDVVLISVFLCILAFVLAWFRSWYWPGGYGLGFKNCCANLTLFFHIYFLSLPFTFYYRQEEPRR